MRKTVLFLLILTGAAVVLFGYFTLLVGWVASYSSDLHSPDHVKAALESAALLVYIYLGVKFFNRHVDSLR